MQKICVSENKRFLCLADKTPFFWLADTAWELFHALSREEAEHYLKTKSSQGYNVVQAVALAEMDGLGTPNAYGRFPLKKDIHGRYDPCAWDLDGEYNYWDHVEAVIRIAETYNIYIAFVVTWGDKYNKAHGVGPEIFNGENAEHYAQLLAARFGKYDNLIWVLGGDRFLNEDRHFQVNNAFAKGLRQTGERGHLITLHPPGAKSSSYHYPDAPWMAFHMLQSGHHAHNIPNYEMIAHDYLLEPVRPVLDGEPRYEDHPVNFNAENGYFDEADVRQAAYWAVFAGGCGHTYGHHSVWRMNREFTPYFPLTWEQAITRPGTVQMKYLKDLILSLDYYSRVPDQSLVSENFPGANYVAATRGKDYALFYAPNGVDIRVVMGKIPGDKVLARWYNPRTGRYEAAGEYENTGVAVFSPRERGRDRDIVLCLTSMDKGE